MSHLHVDFVDVAARPAVKQFDGAEQVFLSAGIDLAQRGAALLRLSGFGVGQQDGHTHHVLMADISLLIGLREIGIRDAAQRQGLAYAGFQRGIGVGVVELLVGHHANDSIGVVDHCIEESPQLAGADVILTPIAQLAVEAERIARVERDVVAHRVAQHADAVETYFRVAIDVVTRTHCAAEVPVFIEAADIRCKGFVGIFLRLVLDLVGRDDLLVELVEEVVAARSERSRRQERKGIFNEFHCSVLVFGLEL